MKRKIIKKGTINKIMSQIILALYIIHEKLIIHRNIDPSNIIMDMDKNIKLIKFNDSIFAADIDNYTN